MKLLIKTSQKISPDFEEEKKRLAHAKCTWNFQWFSISLNCKDKAEIIDFISFTNIGLIDY